MSDIVLSGEYHADINMLITRLPAAEADAAAERDKVRVLREAMEEISDSDPDESAGRLRDIANDGLQATAQEKTK